MFQLGNMTAENGARKNRKEVEQNKGTEWKEGQGEENIFSVNTWKSLKANLVIFKLNL